MAAVAAGIPAVELGAAVGSVGVDFGAVVVAVSAAAALLEVLSRGLLLLLLFAEDGDGWAAELSTLEIDLSNDFLKVACKKSKRERERSNPINGSTRVTHR